MDAQELWETVNKTFTFIRFLQSNTETRKRPRQLKKTYFHTRTPWQIIKNYFDQILNQYLYIKKNIKLQMDHYIKIK